MPLVSIIVPNYNHKIYLKERLDSIFHQIFQDYEVILLDDASTDNSLEVLKLYSDHPKVSHFIVNNTNSGSPFKQWIKGIELSKGEYIWIAESDDVADKLFLEETLRFAKAKDDLGLVFVPSGVIDEKSQIQDWILEPPLKTTGFTIKTIDEISSYLIKELAVLNASSVLFKADSLKSLDFSKLAMFKNSGDRYTYIQIALKTEICFLDKKLNFHRLHSFNTTKKNVSNNSIYYDRLIIIGDLISKFKGHTLACRNLKVFYFKQVFRCSEKSFIKSTREINHSMLKNDIMDFRTYLEMFFLSLFIPIFSGNIPHRMREYYKRNMEKRYLND